jgi:selenocysteine lyase/cysteine desulfurase
MPGLQRREFLGALMLPAALAACASLDPRRAQIALAAAPPPHVPPDKVAQDEDFWSGIARSFTQDRTLVNLNNGGVSPSPATVQNSVKRWLDYAHSQPPALALLGSHPEIETVRERLARSFGTEPGEIAITRNATESLVACEMGFDLQAGDEIVTSTQDYPRMVNAFKQRERRQGVKLVQIQLPVPAEDDAEVVRRFEAAITPRTKLMLCSHMIFLSGQILPVREIVAMAARHGVPCIVDGAHALAHFDFKLSDLQCDYYGSSLHKWLFAPHGTGLLYIRKEKIPGIWPLIGAGPDQDPDIRKFEEVGTHPLANYLAITDALDFHEELGPARKAARLRWLRDRWAHRLLQNDRVKLHTSLDPRWSCGITTVQVDGLKTSELQQWLWNKHRILVTGIVHPEFEGLRVSPSVYTLPDDVDRFAEAVEQALREGIAA